LAIVKSAGDTCLPYLQIEGNGFCLSKLDRAIQVPEMIGSDQISGSRLGFNSSPGFEWFLFSAVSDTLYTIISSETTDFKISAKKVLTKTTVV
jgi:hypothetical protein